MNELKLYEVHHVSIYFLVTNMIADSDQVTIVFPGYNMGQLLANNYKMLEEPKVPTPLCIVCTVAMKYLNTEVQDKSNQVCLNDFISLFLYMINKKFS